ncbi:MAG: M14 family zinc carboxypeptidase [Oligoflexia bacterium]|nr:M14 family zinc carboxypeptidase [Oligoflexia bacterium]
MLHGISAFIFLIFSVTAYAQNPITKYSEVKDFINQTAIKYPQNVRIINVGDSDSGDVILGLQIGNGPTHNLVVGTHHGNEYGSTAVAAAFALALAANPIPDQTVYVIPVLNISGYNSRNRYETTQGRSKDPNRDYPGPCGTEGPFHLKSTANLARFIQEKNIITSATMHTYFPAVVYPWGISTHQTGTLFDTVFQQLARAAVQESRYAIGNSTQMIYPADGTFEDYAYWHHGIWSMLFEIGNSHSPTQSAISHMISVNVPGLRRMLEIAPKARAPNHAFTGQCSSHLKVLDLHNE